VFPARYELGFCIPEDDILHSHCRENLKSYKVRNNGNQAALKNAGKARRTESGDKTGPSFPRRAIPKYVPLIPCWARVLS
jgi:hypothetical protein